VKFSSEKLQSG